jgi:hypothetical protein
MDVAYISLQYVQNVQLFDSNVAVSI